MAATKKTYRVLSLIRMGGKDYEAGGTIDLTETEFEGLRATGAIGTEPARADNSEGAPPHPKGAPTGSAGATDGAVPARGSKVDESQPSGGQASEDSGAGRGEPAPPSVSREEHIRVAALELQGAGKKITVAAVEKIVGFDDVKRTEIDAALAPPRAYHD